MKLTYINSDKLQDNSVDVSKLKSPKFVEYDNLTDGEYTISNKSITVTDTANSDAAATLTGQSLQVMRTTNGEIRNAAGISYDNIAVIAGNGDIIEGTSTQTTTVLLDPTPDNYGVVVKNDFNSGDSSITSITRANSITFSIDDEDVNKSIVVGFNTGDKGQALSGDFVVGIKDGENSAYYALRDTNIDKNDVSYIATEDYVASEISKINKEGAVIDDSSTADDVAWSASKITEELGKVSGVKSASYDEDGTLTIVNESDETYTVKLIPVDDITDDVYGIYNKDISIQDKQDSNAEILLNGQQVMVMDHTGNRVGRVTSVMTDGVASMYASNGDILDGDNQPTQYNAISASSGNDNDGASLTIQSSFNSGVSNISAILTAMNLIFSKNVAGSEVSAQIGFDGDNLDSNNITIVLTDASGKKNYYAIKATDLDNDKSNPAYLATEDIVEAKQNKLTAGTDIKIENDVISVEEEWNVVIFDTTEFNKGLLSVSTPDGYIFDKLYILCHWYGPAGVATSVYGGFYQGTNTDASKQVIRNNGTNKMGAGYFTANIVNMDNTTAIAYGEGYFYNNTGSATTLNNPINSYGIGRYSHSNDFTHFTIHNYPSSITEGYCCIKYKLKKQ